MEELRSTQILDKEIQAEARKKAEKIIQQAKDEVSKILDSTEERVEQAKTEKLAKYEEKTALFEKDQKASIPLEKSRFLVSFIQESIDKACDAYLDSLSENEQIELVVKQLEKYGDAVKSKSFTAFVYGFDLKACEKILSKKADIKSFEKTEFNKLVVEKDSGLTNKKGIILEAVDKSVRIRLTICELISEIQDKYRVDLCEKLFGGRL